MIRSRRMSRTARSLSPSDVQRDVHPLLCATRAIVETLERRQLLCALHQTTPPVELPYTPVEGGPEAAADIVWTNRGQSSDGFASTFGANAETARGVMDAVIESFERMIGSFNYGDGSSTFNLTVNMSGNHNGASASLTGTLGGKPKSGTITMGRGSNGAGSGWFIDPTPHEHSEFMGDIVNAYSGDAQPGSPANGLGDFFTVAAAEITHVLGLYGSQLPLWSSKTTNTGVTDTAEGGGRGTFYVFQGPSIKHLLTSNNGGSGGQNWGSAIHGAGPGVPINFQGTTYIGSQDIGNAVYEFSRRYIPSNTFALMFKDAFGYSTVDPAQFGTFYSVLKPSNGQLTIRGGGSGSGDIVTLSTSGSVLTVSVDVGSDVPGTGHLPGAGDLPAFVTQYDAADVSSIVIQPGDGNDTININGLPAGVSTTVHASFGNDTINVNHLAAGTTLEVLAGENNDTVRLGGGDLAANLLGTLVYNGGTGDDVLVIDDSATAGDTEYTLTTTTFTMTGLSPIDYASLGFEGFSILAGSGSNTINVNSATFGQSVTISAGAGDDTVNLGTGSLALVAAALNVNGGQGNDTVVLDDSTAASGQTYTFTAANVTRVGFSLTYAGAESMRLLADPANSAVFVNGTPANFTLFVNGGSGTDVINVSETDPSGVVVVENSTNPDQLSVNTDGAGLANVRFDSASTRLANLNIGAGGSAALAPGGNVLVTSALTINGTAQLDLADGTLIWDYSGGSPINLLRTFLGNGFAGKAWNGTGGINSSDAAADLAQSKALGYAEATDLFGAFPALFAGEQIDGTSLLVRRTLYGDTNLDGTVNLQDFNKLAANFGAANVGWSDGNLNYDSTVNLNDFNLLAANFGMSVTDLDATAGALAAPTTGASRVPNVDTGAKKRRN